MSRRRIMEIDRSITSADLSPATKRVFELAGGKARLIARTWDASRGTPVFTVAGKYTARGWTEWTQGFQYGCPILTFDATGEQDLLALGRQNTLRFMAPHVTHTGVHDHGFNNLSTYGNLRRLMLEGKIAHDDWELAFYEMALKSSGAVQAARWTSVAGGGGYVYSFNGPHSLFIDTMRTIRILGLAHQLGHVLMGENDARISLLERAVQHALTTARFIVFKGDSGHTYDIRGRTAHEGIFNTNDGNFRCRSTQQGYSPFSTWTRGLAWAMLGFAEQLELFVTIGPKGFESGCGMSYDEVMKTCRQAAEATCDHYINDCSASDGSVYWDDGAPGLAKMPGWRERPADPFNEHEPVDSSAAAIAAQGLLRLGRFLNSAFSASPGTPGEGRGEGLAERLNDSNKTPPRTNPHPNPLPEYRERGRSASDALEKAGDIYTCAGLTIARTIFSDSYLSQAPEHQGLLLHSVYHRPNNWDHIPPGRKVPCGESSMWGDYLAIELALLIHRLAEDGPYYKFFDDAPREKPSGA